MSGAGPPPDGDRELDRLIGELARGLRPVRRLMPVGMQVAASLAVPVALAIAVLASGRVDLAGLAARLLAATDMWLANLAAMATAVLATIAAFMLGRPDRGPAWAWLPAPSVAVWVLASAAGCLRDWRVPGTMIPSLEQASHCFVLILLLAVPLSVALCGLLYRTAPARPGLMTGMAGLASASASASLLELIHPADAASADLIMHGLAVAVVILANRMLCGRRWRKI